nr:helix-turn-helix transcriptional regulator [Chloroflexia bacterium]
TWEGALATSRAALGDAGFAAVWTAGASLDPFVAATEALALVVAEPPLADPVEPPVPVPPPPASREPVAIVRAMPRPPRPRLSRRERQIMQLVIDGQADRVIAESLFIGQRTVAWHLTNVFNKLGVNTRTAAAVAVIRDGLLAAS